MPLHRMKIFPVLLVLLLIFLQYRLWFDDDGVFNMLKLKKQLANAEQDNMALKTRNDNLLKQIQQLQDNQDAIESRARQELGMIKKGEVFYQVVE